MQTQSEHVGATTYQCKRFLNKSSISNLLEILKSSLSPLSTNAINYTIANQIAQQKCATKTLLSGKIEDINIILSSSRLKIGLLMRMKLATLVQGCYSSFTPISVVYF